MAGPDSREGLRAHLFLHFVVFVWGFTAVLGKLITLSATVLVWYRLAFAVAAIGLYLRYRRRTFRVDRAGLAVMGVTGLVVAFHWVCFFESIKQSTISVALVCLSSNTLFTSLIEPVVYRRGLRRHEVSFGLLVIFGVWLIFRFEPEYVVGIVFGLLSALSSAIFTVINGRLVLRYHATVVGFHELLWGWAGLTVYLCIVLPFTDGPVFPTAADVLWLVILGVVCTAFAFIASVEVMKVLTPYTVSLSVNLEPVYGILLALAVFGESERMSGPFYAGAGIILFTIFANGFIQRRLAGTPKARYGDASG